MSQRMINDNFWTDSWVEDRDPSEKLIYLYLLTNPLCNIAGIYEIKIKRIAYETGYDRDTVDKILDRFVEQKKIIRCDDWILIINFAKNQSVNPNVKKGMQRIIEDLPYKIKALKGFETLSHFTLLNLTLPNLTILNSTLPNGEGVEDLENSFDGDDASLSNPTEETSYPPTPLSEINQNVLDFTILQYSNLPSVKYWYDLKGHDQYLIQQQEEYDKLIKDIGKYNLEESFIGIMLQWIKNDKFRVNQIGSIKKLREKNKDKIPYWIVILERMKATESEKKQTIDLSSSK